QRRLGHLDRLINPLFHDAAGRGRHETVEYLDVDPDGHTPIEPVRTVYADDGRAVGISGAQCAAQLIDSLVQTVAAVFLINIWPDRGDQFVTRHAAKAVGREELHQ